MNAQNLLMELKKHFPLRVYGKGPVLELFREMGQFVDKKTPLQVNDAFRSQDSGEIICSISAGEHRVTAALTNLKLEISHPLFRKVRDYRNEVSSDLASQSQNVNRSSFRVRDLYKK